MGSVALAAQRVTLGPGHHSFGYYDKTPWDASGRYLLALRAPFYLRSPRADEAATLGVVDLHDGSRFLPFAETLAWNWQQGCMLQWLPQAPDRLVIYNDREGDRFVSIVRDALTGRIEQRLPLPVYAVSHDGRQALTLNFARLHHQRPGYGYAGVADPWRDVPEPADDGIWWLDLASGTNRLVISVAQLAALRRASSMDGAIHRFNHLQFSPDDQRFIFLHRWRRAPAAKPAPGRGVGAISRRVSGAVRGLARLLRGDEEYASLGLAGRARLGARGLARVLRPGYGSDDAGLTRLCTARPDGTQIAVLADEEMVSHFDWRDPDHVLAWARRNGQDGFFLFRDRGDEATLVDASAMPRDGHCSYSPDPQRRWILNDTAPDERDHRELFLYDTRTSRRVDLGRFYSPPRLTNDVRCDLHPRWSRDGRFVCIDSAHEGSRQLYVLDVSSVVCAE